jgi:hypothetical protein
MMAIKKMSKQEKIDIFISSLEKMIDIRYQINRETEYCNHSYILKLKKETYNPLVEEVKENIKTLLT